jgi:ornithine decarboxylase
LDIGVDPTRIIYAHPCKQSNHIKYASSHRVKLMTFDNLDELDKVKVLCPDAK